MESDPPEPAALRALADQLAQVLQRSFARRVILDPGAAIKAGGGSAGRQLVALGLENPRQVQPQVGRALALGGHPAEICARAANLGILDRDGQHGTTRIPCSLQPQATV